MFTPGDYLPLEELHSRHARCRGLLAGLLPKAGGLLVTGTPNIYYMTGTSANGLVWLPLEGKPVLAVRKGIDRAKLESPIETVVPFKSYKELPRIFADAGVPLPEAVAVDQAGVSWEQGRMLAERLEGHTLLPADMVLARTRAMKSEWELVKIRESGQRLFQCHTILAEHIRPGMSEHDIAQTLWHISSLLDSVVTRLTPKGKCI